MKDAATESVRSSTRRALPPYGVRIESHPHGPGFRTALHRHPHGSLLYIASGRGRCSAGGQEYELAPNTAVLLGRNQPHQLVDAPGAPMTVFVVYFSEQAGTANAQVLTPLQREARPISVPAPYAHHARRLLRQMLHEQDTRTPQYDFAIRQCLSFILLDLHRATLESDQARGLGDDSAERVRKTIEYVRGHSYEPQSLSSAARMAHLSQRQFSSLCRRITGQSFVRFVNGVRADRAADLLRRTDMPVSAIAFEVGFEELSTFYRAFRRRHGASPLKLRTERQT